MATHHSIFMKILNAILIVLLPSSVWAAGGRQASIGSLLMQMGPLAGLRCQVAGSPTEVFIVPSIPSDFSEWSLVLRTSADSSYPGMALRSDSSLSVETVVRRTTAESSTGVVAFSLPIPQPRCKADLTASLKSESVLSAQQAIANLEQTDLDACLRSLGRLPQNPITQAHLQIQGLRNWQLSIGREILPCDVHSLDRDRVSPLETAVLNRTRWETFASSFDQRRAPLAANAETFLRTIRQELSQSQTLGDPDIDSRVGLSLALHYRAVLASNRQLMELTIGWLQQQP